MVRRGRSLPLIAWLCAPGCFLLPDPEVEIRLEFLPDEVLLPPRDYRSPPAVGYFGIRNVNPFSVWVRPEGFEVTTPGLDASTSARVAGMLKTRNDTDIFVPAGGTLMLEITYDDDARSWVHGAYSAEIQLTVGGFDPNVDSGEGSLYRRLQRHEDAWISRQVRLPLSFAVDCDLDLDGFFADSCGGDDCSDGNERSNPAAIEACDGSDNDCDGAIDESGTTAATWFFDGDADGFGDDDAQQSACRKPAGNWVATGGDCDDLQPAAYPGAVELCDDIDNDCNGEVDDSLLDGTWWYEDLDGDGFGKSSITVRSCGPPDLGTWAEAPGDCDDTSHVVFPGAFDSCAPDDRDCDGQGEENCQLEAPDTGDTGGFSPVDTH